MNVGSRATPLLSSDPLGLSVPELAADREEMKVRERLIFDEAAAPLAERLVLHGAGAVGMKTLQGLRSRGVEPLAFSDRNSALWGSVLDGLRVLSPREAAHAYGDNAAFVVTIWNRDHRFSATKAWLNELGCLRIVSCAALFFKFAEIFLPYYCLDLPHRLLAHKEDLVAAYSLMTDKESQQEFANELRFRLRLNLDVIPTRDSSEQFFPTDIASLGKNSVFVDCGAFDGDTLIRFLDKCAGSFKAVLAIEPDPKSYARLRTYVHGLPASMKDRIRCVQASLGASPGKVRFNAAGSQSSHVACNGSEDVERWTLDILAHGLRPSLIKMDIEGAERDALRGADQIIRESLPGLAVCVYHRPDDLWEIPLAIAGFSPRYKLFLRRYAEVPWELVCYAIPVDQGTGP